MTKKLETPCAAPKRGLPCEFKYDFAMSGYAFTMKAWLHVVREEYGAAAALKLYEKISKKGDRIKKLTNTLLTIFNLEGNDAATIGEWFDIFCECAGIDATILERSQTINRVKVTKCPWKTELKDVPFGVIFMDIGAKTINPKLTVERPKAMCEGDPYCEYVWKLEE